MIRYLCSLVVTFGLPFLAFSQYSLRQVTSLGKLKPQLIRYYSNDKEWILSDGYTVFRTDADFSRPVKLFNTFPSYQFAIEKLPNKNIFCRHFDTKSPPYGFAYRGKTIDSSYVYVKDNGYKPVTGVLPNAFVKGRLMNDNNRLRTWAMSNCFNWGKDSTILCTEGVVGVMKVINGKDSLFNIFCNSPFTSFEASEAGEFIAAGTRDSGWIFIPTANPDRYVPVSSGNNLVVSGFYFDEVRKYLWVEESHGWRGLRNLLQYDYNSGVPILRKTIPYESFGLSETNDPVFAFDFHRNKVYVKSVIRQLILFDLSTESIEANLSWPGSQLSAINQVYFNKQDNQLYLAAEKFDPGNKGDSNFIFTLQKDSLLYSNVIHPTTALDKNNLYPKGLHTAVNKLPGNSYASLSQKVGLTNELALIPSSQNEYLLYNSRSGNMIHSFQAVNLDLNISSRFVRENTARLSPDGRNIFEWLIKAGITSGVADTLQMAMSQLVSGNIARNRMLLPAKDRTKIMHVSWDASSRPLFTQLSDGTYPEKIIRVFYLDSSLQPQPLAEYRTKANDVIYDAWNINGTASVLISTGKPGAEKTYHYRLLTTPESEPQIIKSSPTELQVLQNKLGILFTESAGDSILLHWYSKQGKLLRTSVVQNTGYRLQVLADSSANLYLTQQRTDQVARLNLFTGTISHLAAKSRVGYSFAISPAEDLVLCASETIDAWQVAGDDLHKMYQLKAEKDFVKFSQVSSKSLLSDGRIWSFETGQITQSGLFSAALLNDSSYLSTAFNHEVLQNLGFDDNYNTIYGLAPHQQLFSKSLVAAKDLKQWYDRADNILVVSRNFDSAALHNIYELPLQRESMTDVKLYTAAALNSVLIVKSPSELYNRDIFAATADTLLLLNLQTGKTGDKQVGKLVNIKQTTKEGAYLFYLLNQKTKTLQLYKTGNDGLVKLYQPVKISADLPWHANIADENQVVYTTDEGVVFSNLQTGKTDLVRYTYLSGNYISGNSMHYEAERKILYVAYDDGGILKIENGKVTAAVRSMPSAEKIAGENGKYLVVLDKLGHYYFLDKNTLERVLTLYTWPGNNFSDRKFMWLTKENYYLATPGIEKNIHFINNNAVIPLKQGDLQYNRPDKVLEYLGAPKSGIDFYKELHAVRLQKYKNRKINDSSLTSPVKLDVTALPAGKQVTLRINAAGKNNLSALHIMVNGCPVPTAAFSKKSNSVSREITVDLNSGNNTIFTWVEDETGAYSAYNEQKFIGEFADSGKWHFIGIGVSRYKDTTQNLKYADKDIRDIAKFLAKKYPGITIDTLLNENVTKASIQQLAARLKSTGADDKVLVSFSGHGLLDGDKKFYYGTHDIDFRSPAAAGFSMADITAMLEYLPARYRMITLDACHSGDDVSGGKLPAANTRIIAEPQPEVAIKGNVVLGAKPDKNTAKLLKSMQLVFTDQLSNSGINLVAASAGAEFALEGKQWNNGVFTYALLNGWGYAARESSFSQEIHYRSLKQYVQQRVSEITQGKQTPNTVMENGEIDWWLVPGNN